ncbi:uncharacterized protein Z519_03864 [Cladophialophora bantiana CBS 173.52]|uniref:Stress-response A/B barrel domain-containing protein n=1 Tax=Cladophialophora bantiana (strain ATCC 10958 / CBS 173.52 / CDC B-1940 / NIH 8579) TaxID=1442370 RepID=A0A0D2HWH1_CLAB1|nr:uncharacterized protein Z519_03864 [Cladophialophora bantiana CBS 173.52]KIW95280.1 hypothetical protein Z519_03864 [Cladophialophora bantiana CBS 173.52]
MPIYHIVLFKLKPGVTPAQLSAWTTQAKAMVGKIPGLRKLEVNTPLPSTAHRGQGFNMGLVAILDKADDVKVYAEHPAHLEYVLITSTLTLVQIVFFKAFLGAS